MLREKLPALRATIARCASFRAQPGIGTVLIIAAGLFLVALVVPNLAFTASNPPPPAPEPLTEAETTEFWDKEFAPENNICSVEGCETQAVQKRAACFHGERCDASGEERCNCSKITVMLCTEHTTTEPDTILAHIQSQRTLFWNKRATWYAH